MHHTLNKRDTYAKAIHEQKQLEEKLSWGHTGTQEQLPTPTYERRRPPLTVVKGLAAHYKVVYRMRSCQAHEAAAKAFGYNSYNHFLKSQD